MIAIPAAISTVLRYWKLIGVGVLLLAIGVQTLRLSAAEREADKWQAQLAKANALIETQNAAVRAWQDEAARQHKVAREAQAEARKAGDSLRAQAGRAEARRPLSGRCETPPAVAEAARGL
jgi:multidrug resistance efflux pump